jgi:hypothetical protein
MKRARPVEEPATAPRRPFGAVRIVLAGVVHRDPAGADRLWSFLETRRPDGVSVELSRYSLSFRRSHAAVLEAALDENLDDLVRETARTEAGRPHELGHVRAIRAAIGLPYEYDVASTFCRRHGIAFELADLSASSRNHLPDLEELVSMQNLRRLLAEPDVEPREEAERQRTLARRLVRGSPLDPSAWPVESDVENEAREEHMARVIRKSITDSGASRWVHVGGWKHLLWVDGRETLFTRLSDLVPERVVV